MATFTRLQVAAETLRRPRYPSDVTDAQWEQLAPLLQDAPRTGPGRPRRVALREVFNALLYMKQTGCAWRFIPREFPPRSTVHYYFAKWTEDGTFPAAMDRLREATRRRQGRAARPTAAVIDSQTVKTAGPTAEVGWDGGQGLWGRKRHGLVDTEGNLLAVLVLDAHRSDRDGALQLLRLYHAAYPELELIWGDSHYGGPLVDEMQAEYGIRLHPVSKEPGQKGFVLLPRRWVVERTFGWLMRCRRLVRDYERDPGYSEAWIQLAMIHRSVKYLAPTEGVPRPYQRRRIA
jgi:transposase